MLLQTPQTKTWALYIHVQSLHKQDRWSLARFHIILTYLRWITPPFLGPLLGWQTYQTDPRRWSLKLCSTDWSKQLSLAVLQQLLCSSLRHTHFSETKLEHRIVLICRPLDGNRALMYHLALALASCRIENNCPLNKLHHGSNTGAVDVLEEPPWKPLNNKFKLHTRINSN